MEKDSKIYIAGGTGMVGSSIIKRLLSSGYKDAVAFVILLALLFVRPSGLFGRAGGERV